MTVLRKFQLTFKKVGYWPTTYIIQDAMTALFSFPFLLSHNCSKFRRVVMKKDLSSFYGMVPQSDPTVQDKEFKVSKLKAEVFCFSISWMINYFIWLVLYLIKYWASSFYISYRLVFSVFYIYTLTGIPSSSISISTYSGLAIFRTTVFMTSRKIGW